MKLENIGFYTLSNHRAKNVSTKSPIWRLEIILTDRCNFNCSYCRGLKEDLRGNFDLKQVINTIELCAKGGLKNIRFSGGEPTLYGKRNLTKLVSLCKGLGVERIAISTNGFMDIEYYYKLIEHGVNDFSISLDGCCSQVGNKMCGVNNAFEKVVKNIKLLSEHTYVTVGVVFNENNIHDCVNIIDFISGLGVSDIRIIPSAQYNKALSMMKNYSTDYPILKYRISNINKNIQTRGLGEKDCYKCWLALDDLAVAQGYHFPCIIYMREGGMPIGKIPKTHKELRRERFRWFSDHIAFFDDICSGNCLDVCRDYNNKVNKYKLESSNG